ncbi:K+-transporting ATPase KdpC subunit [Streptomyces sp. TLI_235]|nr:potassium-transporting ATPase subunit C [Streptomyces sp. TLI_235]PBC76257.1 K+-transporting ATPase KdpC subunit [Streptomyces sp. TLI_235]
MLRRTPGGHRHQDGLPPPRLAIAAFDGVDPASVPVDAVTASGSGLDPQISVAYAKEQAVRVAKARGIPADTLNRLIDQHTDGRSLGFLGQDGVNVVLLNTALATLKQRPAPPDPGRPVGLRTGRPVCARGVCENRSSGRGG